MSRSNPDQPLTDDELLRVAGAVLDHDEPLPPWAVEFAAGAFAWRDMEGKLAELLHDSDLEAGVVLRDDSTHRLLVFQAGTITLDVEHGPEKLVGALSPPGRYVVQVDDGGLGSLHDRSARLVPTDDTGMFELRPALRGPVRFVVRHPDGQVAVLSPWTTL